MTEQNQQPEAKVLRPLSLRAFVRNAESVVNQTKVNMALKMQKGQLTSLESYHREVGRAEGMDQCIALMKDMLGQLEEAERNQDLPEMTG